jgi:hypothetical protein
MLAGFMFHFLSVTTIGAAAPRPAAVRLPRRLAETGGVLLGYTLLTVLMTWPLATVFTARLPDGTDGWQ